MKTRNIILLAAVIIFSTSCAKKPEVCNDRILVDSLATVAVNAFNSGDVARALSNYTDDVVFLNGNVKMSNKDTISNAFKYMFQHMKNFNYYLGVSSVSKDMIFMEGLFTFDWQIDNNRSIGKGVMLLVYQRQADNSWKITYCEENHGDILKN